MEQSQTKRGSWWLVIGVLLLNIVGTGAGYLLLGRWKRALVAAVICLLSFLAVALKNGLPYWVVIAVFAVDIVYVIWLLCDSPVMARRGRIAPLRFFQKPLVYVLYALIIWGLNFAVQEWALQDDRGGVTFSIPAASMAPTLQVGDYIAASGSFDTGWVRRGDVVIFKMRAGVFYVKRVIGMPNEIFQMKAGVPYINGKPFAQKPAGDVEYDSGEKSLPARLYQETTPEGRHYDIMMIEENGPLDNTSEMKIPEGHVVVLGDNRQNSADSRIADVGFVPLAMVVKKAELIYWSADRSRIGRRVQ